ncbi:2'-5' RNA ligase family protein [Desertivirga brevis]|uniref:2'-5' RNA ligase family protein n=1 Tax=Desertivirga brevis TaxID=2810310 RepID=UPI001A970000|nr:2'-5' RNA ligase family protein [Pedobacter sp. SYSU D00873]
MPLYLTAILLPSPLSEEIDDIRKEISSKYNVYAALKPPVHITLYRPLSIPLTTEKNLIQLLKPVAFMHNSFEQKLQNFDSFNNKTLFVHCVKQPILNNLQKDISAVFHKNKLDPDENKSNSSFHPHITIAFRDVTPEIFIPLWAEYKNRKLKRSFTIDRFTLLRHDGKKWQALEEFLLQKPEELKLF